MTPTHTIGYWPGVTSREGRVSRNRFQGRIRLGVHVTSREGRVSRNPGQLPLKLSKYVTSREGRVSRNGYSIAE